MYKELLIHISNILDSKLEPIINDIKIIRSDINIIKNDIESINNTLFRLEKRLRVCLE